MRSKFFYYHIILFFIYSQHIFAQTSATEHYNKEIDKLRNEIQSLLQSQVNLNIKKIETKQETGFITNPQEINNNFQNLLTAINQRQKINQEIILKVDAIINYEKLILKEYEKFVNKKNLTSIIRNIHSDSGFITNLGSANSIEIIPAKNIQINGKDIIIIAESDENTLKSDGFLIGSLNATNKPSKNTIKGEVVNDDQICYVVSASIHYYAPISGNDTQVLNNSIFMPIKKEQAWKITIENRLNINYQVYWIPFNY